jgi:hypothetical protein
MTRCVWTRARRQPAINLRPREASPPRAPGRRFLPGVDMMEDRTLLSPLTVWSNSDSGPGSLRAIIASAPSGSTIEFASSVHHISLTSGEINITTNLSIDGPGANALILSGSNSSRVLEVSNNATVSFEGLTISGGNAVASDGGGILIDAGATLSINQVDVANNSASADSMGNSGNGGGIENDGSLTVTASVFTNNLATGGDFTDPITEGSSGGAIDSQGPSLSVTTTAFSGNQAVGPATGTGEGNGGAINNSSTASITYSTFNGNEALGRSTNGGAISAGENELTTPPNMTISNCSFTGNEAIGASGADDFTQKFGGQALGGAIASAAPLTISASAFTDNLAQAGNHGNNLNPIDGGPFADSAYGGAIATIASSLTVTSSTFYYNRAIGGSSVAGTGGTAVGGAIESELFATTTLTNVVVFGNQAIGGSGGPGYDGGTGFGGGLYNGVDSTAAVTGSTFYDNLARGGPGGSGASGAQGAGGALANGGGFGQLEIAYLGLTSDTSSLSVADSSLIFNTAQGGAGGAGGSGGNGSGGGVYVFGTTTASIDSTLIFANTALGGSAGSGGLNGQGSGGGLFSDSGGTVQLSASSKVVFDVASTSDDDIFGSYTIT